MRARGSIAMVAVNALLSIPAVGADETSAPRTPASAALVFSGETVAEKPSLRLAWLDLARAPAGVEAVARHEVRALMERMGLDTEWRRAGAAEAARPGEIRVVVVDRLLADPRTGRPILGATVPEKRAFPVVWVHLPGVRTTLGLHPYAASASPPVREIRDVGLAVGRVVAHESVHVLAPALAHGRGLMSSSFSRPALVGPRIAFDPGVAVVVRASLRGAPVPPSAPADLLTVEGADARAGSGRCEATGVADAVIPDLELHPDEGHPR